MTPDKPQKFEGITSKLGLQPQEAVQMVGNKEGKLFIGVPKENSFQEHRIGLTPTAVRALVARGHRIMIECCAGEDCSFDDNHYSEAGAEIADSSKEIFEQADMICKIAPPTMEELQMMKSGQTLFSALNLPTLKKEYLELLKRKKVTAIAYEYMKDNEGSFPFVRSMSEIAGRSTILIGAELLNNVNGGSGVLLGGISGVPPAKIVILGAGVVGTYAAKTAIGLGAQVKVFDNSVYKLMRLQTNVGANVYTSIISPEILEEELKKADVAIGAIHSPAGRAPVIVTEEMVSQMKPGAVIIDVSMDQGGCFATSEITSHDNPAFVKHEVIHYCVPNIPSRVSRTASMAISNIMMPLLVRCEEVGGLNNLVLDDMGIRSGFYSFKGHLTNEHLSIKFGMKMTNLDLLFSGGL